jgi:hypothetical protein
MRRVPSLGSFKIVYKNDDGTTVHVGALGTGQPIVVKCLQLDLCNQDAVSGILLSLRILLFIR